MARKPAQPTISDAEAERRLHHGNRRFSLSGCLIFFLTLAALVIALLAWFEIGPPEPAQRQVRELQRRVVKKFEKSEFAEHLNKEELVQSYQQARDFLTAPEKREEALKKLDQATSAVKAWSSRAAPKVRGYYDSLAEKTESAMESIRSGAQSARGEVEALIEQARELTNGDDSAKAGEAEPDDSAATAE